LLQDPLETAPPRRELAFRAGTRRFELGLDQAGVRARWNDAFVEPAQALARTLPALGWQVRLLSTDADSGDWLRRQDPAASSQEDFGDGPVPVAG
jgi:hypothetical protein